MLGSRSYGPHVPQADDLRQQRRIVFGQRLRALRVAAGLTQEQVAIAAGLDRAFYVDLENARHSVLVDRLYDIADALGVGCQDLFSDVG